MDTKRQDNQYIAINAIHASFLNGQRRDAVDAINEYGIYDFWADYKEYLEHAYINRSTWYEYFTDAAISYHRITN